MNLKGQFPPEKTICTWRWNYPVIHISRGEVRTCDKPYNIRLTDEDFEKYGEDAFLNNPYLMERRREKLFGKRHKDCFSCIKLEDRGIQSSRTGPGPFQDYMNNVVGVEGDFESMSYRDDAKLLRADHPQYLEISLSNICNFKCLYCSPTFSTSWEKEEVRAGNMKKSETESCTQGPPKLFEKYFWQWFEKIHLSLDEVIFIGGEPLLNPNFMEYIDRVNDIMAASKKKGLRDFERKPFQFHIISNFSASEGRFDKFLDYIPKLLENHYVMLEASVEAYGERSEYIRTGQKWDQFEKNVNRVLEEKNPKLRFGLQMAINALCVSSLPALLEWAFELQTKHKKFIDFKENVVVAPEYLSPYILTPDFEKYLSQSYDVVKNTFASKKYGFKEPVFNKWTHERWGLYLRFLESIRMGIVNPTDDSDLQVKFVHFIREMDRRRGTKFNETFPEYNQFFAGCESL